MADILSLSPDSLKAELHKAIDVILQMVQHHKNELKLRQDAFHMKMESAHALVSGYIPPSIVIINVGGVYLRMSRRALTSFPDSRLAWIFNGRWDHLLIRDDKGKVFLDLDQKWIVPIFEALTELDTTEDSTIEDFNVNPSHLLGDDLLGFEICMEFFGLPFKKSEKIQKANELRTKVQNYLKLRGCRFLNNFKWQQQWKLLYNSAVHGSGMVALQGNCWNHNNIILVLRDVDNRLRGFFSSNGFQSSLEGRYVADPLAFAFDLTDPTRQTAIEMNRVRYIVDCSFGIQMDSLSYFQLGQGSEPDSMSYRFKNSMAYGYKYEVKKEIRACEVYVWQVPLLQNLSPVAKNIVSTPEQFPHTPRSGNEITRPSVDILGTQFQQWISVREREISLEKESLEKVEKLFQKELEFMKIYLKRMPEAEERKKHWLSMPSKWIDRAKVEEMWVSDLNTDSITLFDGSNDGTVRIACSAGGSEICTMRNTFQHFPDTPLAKKYASETWEENLSVGLDNEGCVIEDHHPECFRKILNIMRLKALAFDISSIIDIAQKKPHPIKDKLKSVLSNTLQYLLIDEEEFFGTLVQNKDEEEDDPATWSNEKK
eukprot:CAMPEP_0171471492 /NCGR_PEP_ID=MMETSP0946-20130122/739_1 /TAXON_ID=109269 /ORGANISM="Vaucheria litorea, Strain CCMP2940" /LENGTH=597 /DNA_ID=CAMNT_0012000997 /DNA_START=28 /DNA_END=1821 /DNA_ORIENTATION=-